MTWLIHILSMLYWWGWRRRNINLSLDNFDSWWWSRTFYINWNLFNIVNWWRSRCIYIVRDFNILYLYNGRRLMNYFSFNFYRNDLLLGHSEMLLNNWLLLNYELLLDGLLNKDLLLNWLLNNELLLHGLLIHNLLLNGCAT